MNRFPRNDDNYRLALPYFLLGGVLLAVGVSLGSSAMGALAPFPILFGILTVGRAFSEVARGRDPVVVHADSLEIDRVRIPFTEVEAAVLHKGKAADRLVISSAGRMIVLASEHFEARESVCEIDQLVREGMARRPEGSERLGRMQAGLQQSRELMERPARATQLLCALLVAVFLFQLSRADWQMVLAQGFFSPRNLLGLGAAAPSLFLEGQWHRIIAANFLHVAPIHIFLNALALLVLGGQLERLLGRTGLLCIFLVSGLVGAGASMALSSAPLAAGASTAVFGMLGAYLVLHLKRELIPVGFRQSARWWAFILLLNGGISLIPNVGLAAHAGGGVAGALCTLALWRLRPLPVSAKMPAMILTAVLGLVFAAGLWATAQHMSSVSADMAAALPKLAEEAKPDAVNALAWISVTARDAGAEELEAARAIAAKIVETEDERADFRDTLATALYRLERNDEAVEQELVALRLRPDAFMATQLAEFFEAAKTPARPTPTLRPRGAALEVEGLPDGDWTLVALVLEDGARTGLMRAHLKTSAASTPVVKPALPRGATLKVMTLSEHTKDGQSPNSGVWWPNSEEAARQVPYR